MTGKMKTAIGLSVFVVLSAATVSPAMYSPQLGRFMQRDVYASGLPIMTDLLFHGRAPITPEVRFMPREHYGDGMNSYQYVGSKPTGRRDPSGCTYTLVDVAYTGGLQAELRAQDSVRKGIAATLLVAMLGGVINSGQWGTGGLTAAGFDLFLDGIDATMSGAYAAGESLMATAETFAVFMALSQSDALERAKDLWVKALGPHLTKLATGDPNDPRRNNLLRQINDFIYQVEHKVMKGMKGKTKVIWQTAVDAVRTWINNGCMGPPPMMPG